MGKVSHEFSMNCDKNKIKQCTTKLSVYVDYVVCTCIYIYIFSAAKLALARFPLTNALVKACLLATKTCLTYAFVLCDAATIRYFELKLGHTHLCGVDYKYFSPDCCKCNSFGCTAAIRWGNACRGPHSDSLYSGSEHSQFNSPRLVKREAGFPNPRRALIGSNQLWRVDDSPYYGEYDIMLYALILFGLQVRLELLAPWFFQTVSAYALRWVLKHADCYF